jgi:indolepyruvate ferredoxin oxidoreductase beta subunit
MSRFSWQAVVAGVGGQGVLFVTRILAAAARRRTNRVLISEVHGMAQRGGSVLSHLKAGPFFSPLVSPGQAQTLFSLDAGEAIRNLPFLAPGGSLIVNAPDEDYVSAKAKAAMRKQGLESLVMDATAIAQEAGAPKAANVLLLAAAAHAGALPFSSDEIWDVLAASSPKARLEANRKLFDLVA